MEFQTASTREIPACPVCAGKLEVVYHRYEQHVGVCIDCHTSLTIPAKAWGIAENKRQLKTEFGRTG